MTFMASFLAHISDWPGESLTFFPVQQPVTLTEDVAKAVAHIHKRGVIHRDIKPVPWSDAYWAALCQKAFF